MNEHDKEQSIGFWSTTKSIFALIGGSIKIAKDGMNVLTNKTGELVEEVNRSLTLMLVTQYEVYHKDGSEITDYDLAEALLSAIDEDNNKVLILLAEEFDVDLTYYHQKIKKRDRINKILSDRKN